MIEIEVARAGIGGHNRLRAADVVLVAVDDGPDSLIAKRPAAGIDAVVKHGVERLPVRTDEKGSNGALDGGDAARGLSSARRDAVPYAPYIFPALPAFAVEEGELQIIGLIAAPTVLDIDLVTRLKPAVAINCGNELKRILAPGENIPRQLFVVRAAFGLECERMIDFFGSEGKCERHTIL